MQRETSKLANKLHTLSREKKYRQVLLHEKTKNDNHDENEEEIKQIIQKAKQEDALVQNFELTLRQYSRWHHVSIGDDCAIYCDKSVSFGDNEDCFLVDAIISCPMVITLLLFKEANYWHKWLSFVSDSISCCENISKNDIHQTEKIWCAFDMWPFQKRDTCLELKSFDYLCEKEKAFYLLFCHLENPLIKKKDGGEMERIWIEKLYLKLIPLNGIPARVDCFCYVLGITSSRIQEIRKLESLRDSTHLFDTFHTILSTRHLQSLSNTL